MTQDPMTQDPKTQNDARNEARNEAWWRDAVIYQIYPRSWADGNGDGMGDLPGITSRLDHLADLGVDAVWLSPFYRSPQNDAGYDVADYRDIDPSFGTLADADALVDRAHELGIRVIVDLVPNHSSSEHAWFQQALSSASGQPGAGPLHLPRRQGAATGPCRRTTGRACSAGRPGSGSSRPTAARASGTSTCSTSPSPTSTG